MYVQNSKIETIFRPKDKKTAKMAGTSMTRFVTGRSVTGRLLIWTFGNWTFSNWTFSN